MSYFQHTEEEIENLESDLSVQRAANRDLLRTIADLTLKHDYQVRRADSAEKRVFELKDAYDYEFTQANDLKEELQLLKHILLEVANGRFHKVAPGQFLPSFDEVSSPAVSKNDPVDPVFRTDKKTSYDRLVERLDEERQITLREQAEQSQKPQTNPVCKGDIY